MEHPSAASEARRNIPSRLPLPPGVLAGFLAAILAIVLVAIFSYRVLSTRSKEGDLVVRSFEAMQQLQALLLTVNGAQTGQRGFLLTGDESDLQPYAKAEAALPRELEALERLTSGNVQQQQRIALLRKLTAAKMAGLGETIALRQAGNTARALAIVRTARGEAALDRINGVIADMQGEEHDLLALREREWDATARQSSLVTSMGSAVLLLLIAAAALMASRDYRERRRQAWVRSGQMGISTRIQAERRLDKLGENVLAFLAEYLDAQAGAVYVAEPDGTFRRLAAYAVAPDSGGTVLRPGESLLGESARANRPLHVRDVPEDYLPIVSGLGRSTPREILIAPAAADGVVQAVVELGFFRTVRKADRELMARVSESLAVAVRTSKDRTRLEELLERTQKQAEELQTQQEELRVVNEELEVQSRSLKESQAQLEMQQTELEQSNAQLEEHTQLLESERDKLMKAQVSLTEKAVEVERSNQYKSEFLANMSHELRTPLNSTLILAKLLSDNEQGNLTGEQVRFAQTISSAGHDLLAVINDILDLSKIEAGKMEVTPGAVALCSVVDSLTAAFQGFAQQKGLTFETAVAADAPEKIETDYGRLGQILRNLLSNAFKFTEKGKILLDISAPTPGTVAFTVRDTGIGIPAHQQEVIFEAFRQADGSTHRKYGGTGLGLSISRDLARLLGGDITVQSAADAGSAFTLTLPRVFVGHPAARADGACEPRPARPAGGAADLHATALLPPSSAQVLAPIAMDDDRKQLAPDSRMILVVEDDAPFAAILRDLAHEMGFKCVVTHTAADAMIAATTLHPSAIVLDVRLPDHSGLGVLDQLKHDPRVRHVPVHVVSVTDFSREALERGAVGYALKPVKREQLVEAFQRLEAKLSQKLHRVLIVEDDARQRMSIEQLLAADGVEITAVPSAAPALERLQTVTFDCMVMDLNLPDLSGYELLEKMAAQENVSFPPVIVYTGRSLTREEEHRLRRFSSSIIIKDARSPERLLDEVTLFLHQVESKLPLERQWMLKKARDRDAVLEARRILVAEDDVRNIFALSRVLEPQGAKVEIARNGREALEALSRSAAQPGSAIDLVLMDIMMPEMDGITAIREIRKHPEWQKLPIIALTAKAMQSDQEKCLAAGANDYIAKPLDVERLLSLVRVWLR